MELPHLALTVVESQGEMGRYHRLLLQAIGDADRDSFPTAY